MLHCEMLPKRRNSFNVGEKGDIIIRPRKYATHIHALRCTWGTVAITTTVSNREILKEKKERKIANIQGEVYGKDECWAKKMEKHRKRKWGVGMIKKWRYGIENDYVDERK